jgi:hypothetical protein
VGDDWALSRRIFCLSLRSWRSLKALLEKGTIGRGFQVPLEFNGAL